MTIDPQKQAGRLKSAARMGAEAGKKHGAAAGEAIGRTTKAIMKTRTGRIAAKGALGGAAVGAILPFMTLVGGAVLGAGALVLWKSAKNQD